MAPLVSGGTGRPSGFTWSPEYGANITPADEAAWVGFVKVCQSYYVHISL